jgi:hypothetical protein
VEKPFDGINSGLFLMNKKGLINLTKGQRREMDLLTNTSFPGWQVGISNYFISSE